MATAYRRAVGWRGDMGGREVAMLAVLLAACTQRSGPLVPPVPAPAPIPPPGTTGSTGDTGSAPCTPGPDTDGDHVPDDAELAVTGTDPAVFDGGCNDWGDERAVASGFGGISIAAADLDGDGDQDLAFDGDGATLAWTANLGGGTFGERVSLWSGYHVDAYGQTVLDGLRRVVAGDVDADGDTDLVARGYTTVYVENLGGGGFDGAVVVDLDAELAGLVDMDADGDLDVLTSGPLAWIERLPDGFAAPAPFAEVDPDRGLDIGDVDGDGDPDIAYAEFDRMVVGWLENRGGSFVDHPTPAPTVGLVRIADLDGDGDGDLVQSGGADDLLWLWENVAGFAGRTELRVRPNLLSLVPADLDGDGDVDLVAAAYPRLVLWYPGVDGTIGPGLPVGSGDHHLESLVLADIDGDGSPDALLDDPTGPIWYRSPHADRDGDGLTYDDEVCLTGTDPQLADSDGDGVGDLDELCVGG
jgi:hypothetical protein